MDLAVCADFGSTFTKTQLVSLDDGALVAAAEHRTTVGTDVLHGFAACRDVLVRATPAAADAPVLACSSAGGGLRLAVVGNEELVTAEAGRRVALSSGGQVVHVGARGLDPERLAALRAAEPDVVLLAGGTDGGNADVLVGAAEALAAVAWPGPVVVAGNSAAGDPIAASLRAGGVPCELVANVVPRIGVLAPAAARSAIRRVFLRHVIGGKHLSASSDFAAMIMGPTPDVVLTGVEVLAGLVGDVAVVDVGGATTDVHSVVEIGPEEAELSRQVVAPTRVTRTVEADLGMRWSAKPVVDRGVEASLVARHERDRLARAAQQRRADPGFVPAGAVDRADDHRLAEVAVAVALRRHAGRQQVRLGPDGRVLERSGRDLREVDVLVGSGGALRHAAPTAAVDLLRGCVGEASGGWLLPRAPTLAVDRDCVLAAAGLLARSHPGAARTLLRRHLR